MKVSLVSNNSNTSEIYLVVVFVDKLICCLLFSQAFRDVISNDGVLPELTRKLLFSTFDPIYDFHCSFLSELEQRMNLW